MCSREAVALQRTRFLWEGRHQEEIRLWAKYNILELGEVGDRRQLATIRSYLGSTSGELASEVRARAEERAAAEGSRRYTRRRVQDEVNQANIIAEPRLSDVQRPAFHHPQAQAGSSPPGFVTQ